MDANGVEEKNSSTYYEEKGKVRFMMVTSIEHKAELTRRCKSLRVSQGALLEIFLDFADDIDPVSMSLAVETKRQQKKSARVSFSSINKRLKGFTKEQLLAVEKAIEEASKLAVS